MGTDRDPLFSPTDADNFIFNCTSGACNHQPSGYTMPAAAESVSVRSSARLTPIVHRDERSRCLPRPSASEALMRCTLMSEATRKLLSGPAYICRH